MSDIGLQSYGLRVPRVTRVRRHVPVDDGKFQLQVEADDERVTGFFLTSCTANLRNPSGYEYVEHSPQFVLTVSNWPQVKEAIENVIAEQKEETAKLDLLEKIES